MRKNLIRAMAISGAFAGLAGGLDMLGYLYRFGVSDIPVSAVGFLGIAVALLGRNTAVGVGLAALLFGALLFGTNHGLQSSEIDPGLASNLTYMIQGLIVLFVGADVLILSVWNARKRAPPASAATDGRRRRRDMSAGTDLADARWAQPRATRMIGTRRRAARRARLLPDASRRSGAHDRLVGVRRHPRDRLRDLGR